MPVVDWGYEGENGPENWHKLYPNANGHKQSPINIKTSDAKHDSSLKPISISYDPATAKEIVHVGHSVNVYYEDSDDRSVMKGGPFTDNYRLHQFHFHWGSSDDHGSEHTVDGHTYSAEIHIVHWNSSKYSSFDEASSKPDGLAICAIFMKAGKANPNVQKILEAVNLLQAKAESVPFKNFDPSTFLPPSKDYWTYEGSLTVPPLYESVRWIIIKESIDVSSEQLAQLRKIPAHIQNDIPKPIRHNYRPVQPLHNRTVKASF